MSNTIQKHIKPAAWPIRYFFFVAGIVATIAYRITPFLDPWAVKVCWYIGTIGFVLYFWHRSVIEAKRARLVKEYELVNVVENSDIVPEEKEAVAYLVKTSLISKARFNSVFIVITSVLALVAAIMVDLRLW